MEQLTIAQVADLAGQVALSAVLLWLVVSERKAHETTRRQYRDDLLKLIGELNDILKDIAGLKPTWNAQRDRTATRPLPNLQPDE